MEEARNVYSSRMIFRDLVNAVDPGLFEIWSSGKLGDEKLIKSRLDRIGLPFANVIYTLEVSYIHIWRVIEKKLPPWI